MRQFVDNARLEELRDITDDVIEADFVPFACAIDSETLLTKNGEVVQIIKIAGYSYDQAEAASADLRQAIRRALSKAIPDCHYAIWLTTLRRKKSLSPDGQFPDDFSAHVHQAWKERNQWDKKYINELYITLVHEGQSTDIRNIQSFLKAMLPLRESKLRNRYIDESAAALTRVSNIMLAELSGFGARRLGVVKRADGIYYGEHLEFLEKLINLEERPMPMLRQDLAEYLTAGDITFAYNAMEVRTAEGDRRFGAILTVKEYKEASLTRMDEFLQLPCEMIITQCLSFVNAHTALNAQQEQYFYMTTGEDKDVAKWAELQGDVATNTYRDVDFCEQQTLIFVLAESTRSLEFQIKQVRDALNDMAILTVREDIKLEECYWAQVPANFPFLARLSYMDVNHTAGFANLHNYPSGNARGCPWGAPVTLFYTAAGTPYFFNFHREENGHTTVIGPLGSGKSVLINFLLSEARKYHNRLFYLDAHGHARYFIEAMGGHYYDVGSRQLASDALNPASLNPFSLADKPVNREFLAMWLLVLAGERFVQQSTTLMPIVTSVVSELYKAESVQRNLAHAVRQIEPRAAELAGALTRWLPGGTHAGLFDAQQEHIRPASHILAFNLQPFMGNPDILMPLCAYLLHRMTMNLDMTPTILMLDEGFTLVNNPMFAARIKGWLDYLTSRNALALFTTEMIDIAAGYTHTPAIIEATGSHIFMPDPRPSALYRDVFGLNMDDFNLLEAMSVRYRHFLLKRGAEVIIGELNLGGLDDILAVLSGAKPIRATVTLSETPADAPVPASGFGALAYD